MRSADGISLDWWIEADGARTRYSLLRWDDVVRARFPRPEWRRLAEVPALLWRLRRSGYRRRLRREARRFATVMGGVHALYLGLAALSLALGVGLAALLAAFLAPWLPASVQPLARIALPLLAGPALAYPILAGLTRLTRGRPFYVAHLVDDAAFTHDHAAGREARMPPRLNAFAARIRDAERLAAASGPDGADEIVVVGHSSSSFLGVEVLARALAADPEFGRRGAPVTFVTLGSVIPWLTLDPAADEARRALARLGAAGWIGWLDVRAPWDWLSIHLRDPLSASGLPGGGPGRPAVLRVRLSQLVPPEAVARRRWNLFRMHFQLLMASRSADGFDYVALVCGPEPVHAAAARHAPAPRETAPA